ncbi:MAG: F0F1 ATP synthase subunit A [Marinilabiliaceae bacterium]|nr:F0F1 ATP synthase subunit A [Marinilabiliaceae bacterium]
MRKILCLLICVVFTGTLFASGSEKGDEFDASTLIMHHIGDSHEWNIISFNKGKENELNITLPLPIILWHKGLHIFMSSKLHKIVKIGDNYVLYEHGHFYITDSNGELFDAEGNIYIKNAEGEIIDAEGAVFTDFDKIINAHPLDFSITQNTASMFMGAILLLLIFGQAARGYIKRGGLSVPQGVQLLVEPLVLFVRDDIVYQQIEDQRKADFFVPYLLTLFCFILINNLIGLVPFFPGASNVSGNISFTFTLAIISFLAVNIFASRDYWKHIFFAPGIPFLIKIFIVPVEFVGLFTKPFALMLRLFANITAGHIIILSLASIIFVMKSFFASPLTIILALVMFCLELLVAFLQAYIFTLLTALFIGMAVNKAHH